MDDYQLLVTYTDFYGVWKKLQPALIREGPLSICLNLNIDNEDDIQKCPFFSPYFVEQDDGDSLCHLFVIAYDSKFDTNQTTAINIWRSKHPGTAFLVLIMSVAKSQWSFTTQRSKIESLFNNSVPSSRIVIAKYFLDDKLISDSDLKAIHSSLANLIQISNQDRISLLQQQMAKLNKNSQEYVRTATELASLYHTFGFLSESKKIYYDIITSPIDIPFWPPSPKNYDIRRLTTKTSFDFGYDIMINSIHGIAKSLIQTNNIVELCDKISLCFAIVLENSKTSEEKIFSRHWIHFTAVNMCDMIENGSMENKEIPSQSFSMIALAQILYLLETKGNPTNSSFLENVTKGNSALADEVSRNQLFLNEWTRSKKIVEGCAMHQAYLASLFFKFFVNKGDAKGAMAAIENTILDPNFSKKKRSFGVDSNMLELLFSMNDMRTENLAILLISSSVKDEMKIEALKYLANSEVEVRPEFSISPLFYSPEIFDLHEIYDCFHCKVSFKLPKWLCGLEATVWVQLSSSELSEDYCLLCEMKKYTLEPHMTLEPSINCNFSGRFDAMLLIIQYESVFIVWDIPIPSELVVLERGAPPSFDFLMPCMISKGCLQSGIFTAQNLDISSLEVSFTFEMDGLQDIVYVTPDGEEKHYAPNTPIVLNHFETTIKMTLIYRMRSNNTMGVLFNFLRRDGQTSTLTQQFTLPTISSFNIRLFKQTAKLQQFQIVNVYPQSFSFEFDGKTHVMSPNALYSIVREASNSPLILTFREKGWEDYPIEILTSNFMLDKVTVKLSFERPNKWSVGEPMLVTVEPPAIAMMEDEKNWVIAPQDSVGKTHLFIPKHPGKLPLPKFQIMQQVAEPIPKEVEILFNTYPPIIPF